MTFLVLLDCFSVSADAVNEEAGQASKAKANSMKPGKYLQPEEGHYDSGKLPEAKKEADAKNAAVGDILPLSVDTKNMSAAEFVAYSLKRDKQILGTVVANGWEALPLIVHSDSDKSLLTTEGRPVTEVSGKPAAILSEYGCLDVVSRNFRRGQRFCALTIFSFATPQGAFGAYSVMRKGASTVVLRGAASSEDDESISFWKGNRFCLLSTTSQNDDESKELLGKLADTLLPKLDGEDPVPLLFRQLPNWEKVPGTEKLFLGPQALRHYSNIPFGNSLLLERAQSAVVSDYAISAPYRERLKLLLIEYGTAELAQSAFSEYVLNICLYGDTVERNNKSALVRISDAYLMCQISGSRIAVISGARKKYSPSVLVRQLRY